MSPVRIQRKRSKGFRLQEASPNGLPVVYCGRPSKWANPFTIAKYGREGAVEMFHTALCGPVTPMQAAAFMSVWDKRFTPESVMELHGVNLCCWCQEDEPCHCDVLLDIANPEDA